MKRLKILIWHVHANYLYYLTHAPHDFYLPSKEDRRGDYIGTSGPIPLGDNVHDVPVESVRSLDLDCIIFQLPHQYLNDQYEILSQEQRHLPKIYLQHDAPAAHPVDARHVVDDPEVLVVHVTAFNRLMWNSGRCPTEVVDHGVAVPRGIEYTGMFPKGIVVVNHLALGGRMLGKDVYEQAFENIPLDLVGIAAQDMPGGIGQIPHKDLCAFESRYRFFFNPSRYTSFPLALCEAMMIGMPVVALATTEAATLPHGLVGYISTSTESLIEGMRELLNDRERARELGINARAYAQERFNIHRFIKDWNKVLCSSVGISVNEGLFV